MSVSRRDLIKVGGLGGLGIIGAGLVTVPISTVSAKSASQLKSSDMPRPYVAAFVRPPVLSPFSVSTDPDGAKVNHYRITMRQAAAQILPRKKTNILGFNGIFPGPTIELEQGTRSKVHMRNQLPKNAPDTRPPAGDIHAPARLGVAAAVRRLRQRRDNARVLQGLLLPELPGCPHALVPRSRRPPHRPERLLRPRRAVHHARRAGARAAPQGDFDVPLIIGDAMFAANGSLGVRRQTATPACGAT